MRDTNCHSNLENDHVRDPHLLLLSTAFCILVLLFDEYASEIRIFDGTNILHQVMASWLLKTEPKSYSFQQLLDEGTTRWEGVKNNLALKYIGQMKKGDQVFIYHSGTERAIVGLAEIISMPYSDPARAGSKELVVDIKADRILPRPFPLHEMKSMKEFSTFQLVTISRLSVMPVSPELSKLILKLSAH